MLLLNNVDPKKMIVTFCGMLITGWGKGSALSLEVPEEGWKDKTGNTGEYARLKVYNTTGKATLRILQTSHINDFLSNRYMLDKNTGLGFGEFLAKDAGGKTSFMSPTAYVSNIPKGDFGDEINEREWVIICPNVQYFLGGNII